jgi:hypothetical protein
MAALVRVLERELPNHSKVVMSMLLSLDSHPDCSPKLKPSIQESLVTLSKKCGFLSLEECFYSELEYFVEQFMAD